jgi:hypothetical protein
MADNFNLNKFIRNNPLLKESIGGYRDIKPMKEMDYELEKPENIYADEEGESEMYGRAWGLAGQQLKSAIDALRQDGFDDEDIKNFLMTGIDMYDQVFGDYDDLEENLDGQAAQGYDSEPTKTFKINIDIEALGELDDEFETRNNVKVKKPKGAEELLARYNDMTDIEKYKYSSVPVNFTGTKDALANLLDGDLASQIYGESDAYFRRLNRLFKAPENMNEIEEEEWVWKATDQQQKPYKTLYVKPMEDKLIVTADDGFPGTVYTKKDIQDAIKTGSETIWFRRLYLTLDTRMRDWAQKN